MLMIIRHSKMDFYMLLLDNYFFFSGRCRECAGTMEIIIVCQRL